MVSINFYSKNQDENDNSSRILDISWNKNDATMIMEITLRILEILYGNLNFIYANG